MCNFCRDEHHLIVAHEVTNQIVDRGQLPKIEGRPRRPLPTPAIHGANLLACRDIDVNALVPRANTSNAKAERRRGKEVFVYLRDQDAYHCSEVLIVHGFWTEARRPRLRAVKK